MNTATPSDRKGIQARLNELLTAVGIDELTPSQGTAFETYLLLLLRWNARINLTSVRDEEGILRRHFVESIFCAHAIPHGVHSLLDFGSGGGFPGIPIALLRPEIAVTLAESQGRKAAFLQEAARILNAGFAVHGARAEALANRFDCVILRAVDHMARATELASKLVASGGSIALLTTKADRTVIEDAAGPGFAWRDPVNLPYSDNRILLFGTPTKSD